MDKSSSSYNKSFEQYQEEEQYHHSQFFKFFELQNRVLHPDTSVPGGGEQYIVDKNLWKCRFCNKTKDDGASFKKKAHILPEQLGNKLIVSHSECDDRNMLFADLENHLSNYLGPLKTLLGVKGKPKKGNRIPKHNISSRGTKITHKGENIFWEQSIDSSLIRLDSPNEVSFGVMHNSYNPLSTWKALSRTSIHLLDLNEIDQFSWYIKSITTNNNDKELTESDGLCMVISIFIPSASNIFPKPVFELYKRKSSNLFGIENFALSEKAYVVKTSSHIFQIQVFSDNDYKELARVSKSDTDQHSIPIYPLPVNQKFFEKFDLPKRKALRFNSTTIEDDVTNWIQFRYSNIKPITTELLIEHGFSEYEIKRLRSNEQDSPETLRKFSDLIDSIKLTS